jgi:ATP-dependent helicase HrpA
MRELSSCAAPKPSRASGLLAQEICRLVGQILTDWQAVQKKLPAFKAHAAACRMSKSSSAA